MNTRAGRYVSQTSGFKAFIPELLSSGKFRINRDDELVSLLSEADRSLARLDGMTQILPDLDIFIFMYVKKEALLSSQIEGTQASLQGVLEFEADLSHKGEKINDMQDIKEVINYQKAMNYGIKRLQDFPMSMRLIREIHNILLTDTRGNNKTPGEFRESQNWIGPQGSTIETAAFIPPPAAEIIALMGDIEKYLYADDKIPPLEKIALIHYQFETIHPFLDGNGRVGRLLITFYLLWKNILASPVLYLSYYFKKNRQEYYDRLNNVRMNDDVEGWIKFFLAGVIEVSRDAASTARDVIALKESLVEKYSSSSIYAVKLINYIFHNPFVNNKKISEYLKVSRQTAFNLIGIFEKQGVLKEYTGKKRWKEYIFTDYVEKIKKGTEGQ
ncbi:MAG: Fic family protein [Candidatus Goldbacteria bacterium]|nr:Fic family protein [Candidatus Goldiibacteriota bacterium]